MSSRYASNFQAFLQDFVVNFEELSPREWGYLHFTPTYLYLCWPGQQTPLIFKMMLEIEIVYTGNIHSEARASEWQENWRELHSLFKPSNKSLNLFPTGSTVLYNWKIEDATNIIMIVVHLFNIFKKFWSRIPSVLLMVTWSWMR